MFSLIFYYSNFYNDDRQKKYSTVKKITVTRQGSGALPTNAARKVDVLGNDGDTVGVNRAKIGVLEETNKVRLSSLLEGGDGGGLEPEVADGEGLEPEVGLHVLGNLTNKALEGESADEELSGLLVLPDLIEGDGAGAVAVGLPDSTGGRGGLAGGDSPLPFPGRARRWIAI